MSLGRRFCACDRQEAESSSVIFGFLSQIVTRHLGSMQAHWPLGEAEHKCSRPFALAKPMSESVASAFDCCVTCDEPATVVTPGNPGGDGIDGTNGIDGINAWTTLTAAFTMPAEAASDTAFVLDSSWMAVGQKVFLGGGGARGTFEVTAKPTALSVTLLNVEDTALAYYLDNSPPGTIFPIATQLSPSGLQGPDALATGGALLAVNNLNDVANAATSRTNLGLGTAAQRTTGNANLQVPFVNNAAGLIAGMPVFATAAGIETEANLLLSQAALGIIFGTADTNVLIVDDAANLTAGQALFATASGVESLAAGPARTALGLTAAMSFRADLNAVPSAAIGVGVITAMDLTTVRFDTSGSWMSVGTNRFTPVTAGYYFLQASSLWLEGAGIAGMGYVYIYKNGVVIARGAVALQNTLINSQPVVVSALVNANGTDYFEVFVMSDTGAVNLDGNINETYFSGFSVG